MKKINSKCILYTTYYTYYPLPFIFLCLSTCIYFRRKLTRIEIYSNNSVMAEKCIHMLNIRVFYMLIWRKSKPFIIKM